MRNRIVVLSRVRNPDALHVGPQGRFHTEWRVLEDENLLGPNVGRKFTCGQFENFWLGFRNGDLKQKMIMTKKEVN